VGLAGKRIGTVLATVIVLAFGLGLSFSISTDGAGGMRIWPLFGTTNQILAGLTLSIVAVMLMRKRRSPLPALVPLVFVFSMSVAAAIVQVGQFYSDGDWLLLTLDLIILVAALWVIVEAIGAMAKARREPADE